MDHELQNRCGGCTLCCQLLEVKPLNKAAGWDCEHCTDDGCAIWGGHPVECKKHVCLWWANPTFPDELRPDLCGVLFEPGGQKVMLAASKIGAWRHGIAWTFIQKCISEGLAVIVQEPKGDGKTRKFFLLPDGDSYREVRARVSEDARRRGYVS